MRHRTQTDDTRELAALYALGALDGTEVGAFEQHLAEGCSSCKAEVDSFKEVVGLLATSVAAVQPRPEIRAELMTRLATEPDTPSSQERHSTVEQIGLTFVRATEGTWQEAMPGIMIKPLFVDPVQRRTTALVRMAAGTRYAPHRHTEPEELYVLEGTCLCGGQLLHVGDYHRAEAESIHTDTYTSDGCLMLVIFSPDNEMLESLA